MTGEIARVTERVRQMRAARAPTPPTTRAADGTHGGAGANRFAAGGKAFDLITGEPVEVISGARENLVVPTAERADR